MPTVEPEFTTTEILAFPSKSLRNKNGSDPIDEKTTPIYPMIGIISITNSNNNDNFPLLFSWLFS